MKKIIINLLKNKGYEIVKLKKIDTFIISFPKSGRTWLNFLLGKFFEKQLGFPDLKPDILFDLKLFNSFFPDEIPLINFSHDDNKDFFRPPEKLNKNKNKYKNSNVIFLVRDPRDVLISSYFEKTKRVNFSKRKNTFWKPFTGTISDYLHEKNGGFDTIIKFYNIWYENKNIPENFMLIKYENLHKNTVNQLIKIVKFIGIKNIKSEAIKKAVEYGGFKNMQNIEKNSNIKTIKLKPADKNDINTYKTRRGKINGFTDYLNNEEIKYLTEKMKKKLNKYFDY